MLEELLHRLGIPSEEEHQVFDAVPHPHQQVVQYHGTSGVVFGGESINLVDARYH